MKIIKYGLKHIKSGNLLSFRSECCDKIDGIETVYLENYSNQSIDNLFPDLNNIWLVDTKYNAEYVRHSRGKQWFEADMSTPKHFFDEKELEVVEIEIEVNISSKNINVILPSANEIFESKYNKKKKNQRMYLQRKLESIEEYSSDFPYSLGEYKEFLIKKGLI